MAGLVRKAGVGWLLADLCWLGHPGPPDAGPPISHPPAGQPEAPSFGNTGE